MGSVKPYMGRHGVKNLDRGQKHFFWILFYINFFYWMFLKMFGSISCGINQDFTLGPLPVALAHFLHRVIDIDFMDFQGEYFINISCVFIHRKHRILYIPKLQLTCKIQMEIFPSVWILCKMNLRALIIEFLHIYY